MTGRAPRIAVIGGGITGLAAAHRALTIDSDVPVHVTVYDRADRIGGRLDTAPFAGIDAIDLAADAFLARVPDAVEFAHAVGLGDELVSPEPVGAAVWHNGLHDIPDGLLLGVPGKLGPLARTRLLSPLGKARAAIEPLLPRTPLDDDAIGAFVRARFGDEVHERLVDPLVGGIYATDTDHFSLAEVPQLSALAQKGRSVLLAARSMRAAAGTATAAASPVFATPRGGLRQLVDAAAAAVRDSGGDIRTGVEIVALREADGWQLDAEPDERFDAVILATPAQVTRQILAGSAPEASALLTQAETADVAMILLHVTAEQWPRRLHGKSGYLVPKPVQRSVTAASFGSQKWAHWAPADGSQVLRVSIGRDGAPALHLSDEELLSAAIDDLEMHLDVRFDPVESRVVRWPGAFAQYRPHHRTWVEAVERQLPDGVFVAGSSFHGIGIPACVRSGRTIAERAAQSAQPL